MTLKLVINKRKERNKDATIVFGAFVRLSSEETIATLASEVTER